MPRGVTPPPGESLYPECYRPGTSGERRHWVERTVTCARCREQQRRKLIRYRMRSAYLGPRTVDAVGSQRRIEALARIGYSRIDIAEQLNIHPAGITRIMRQRTMWADTAAAVHRVYDRLVRSGELGPSPQARARAVRLGLPGPMDWDEDTIDSPGAVPACVIEADHAEALVAYRAECKRQTNKARAAQYRADARQRTEAA